MGSSGREPTPLVIEEAPATEQPLHRQRLASTDDLLPPRLPVNRQLAPESGLGFRLSRLARTLRAEWGREVEELGLTPPQAALLRGIASHSGCSLRALARVLATDPMKVKRCIDELERRGLVTSAHRGADRRPRALALTAEGHAVTRRVNALVQVREEHLDTVLGADRRARFEEAVLALENDLGLDVAVFGGDADETLPADGATSASTATLKTLNSPASTSPTRGRHDH